MATLENVNGLNPQQVRPKPRDSPSSRPRPPPRPTPSPVWRKRRYRALSTVAARSCAFSPPTPRARRYVSTSFAHLGPVSFLRRQVPALVMRSVENARSALDDGDFERAIKMMNSTDQLCSKVVWARSSTSGARRLAMRVLSDAYVKKGELESAKAALEKGLALCKPHDGRAGMPPFMRADLKRMATCSVEAQGHVQQRVTSTRWRAGGCGRRSRGSTCWARTSSSRRRTIASRSP